jgi:hypothetical protein
MLGNDADKFFTTPMPTSITTQAAQAAAAREMPAPRPLSQSATVAVRANEFMPGMGAEQVAPPAVVDRFIPGIGGIMDTVKSVPLWGWALLAGGLFFTRPGKRLLRKVRGA